MEDDLAARIGTFFILVGFSLLVLFIGSIKGDDIHGMYLLLSFGAFIVGWLFRRNKPAKNSGRFGVIRRANERNRRRREESLNKRRNRGNAPGRQRPVPESGSENTEEKNGNENG
jgi:hypothetical protein